MNPSWARIMGINWPSIPRRSFGQVRHLPDVAEAWFTLWSGI